MKPRKGQKIWRFLQENPKAWTQRALARTSDSTIVEVGDPQAVCWCAAGLLELFYSNSYLAACRKLTHVTRFELLTTWNDAGERTTQDVIEAFKKAEL